MSKENAESKANEPPPNLIGEKLDREKQADLRFEFVKFMLLGD